MREIPVLVLICDTTMEKRATTRHRGVTDENSRDWDCFIAVSDIIVVDFTSMVRWTPQLSTKNHLQQRVRPISLWLSTAINRAVFLFSHTQKRKKAHRLTRAVCPVSLLSAAHHIFFLTELCVCVFVQEKRLAQFIAWHSFPWIPLKHSSAPPPSYPCSTVCSLQICLVCTLDVDLFSWNTQWEHIQPSLLVLTGAFQELPKDYSGIKVFRKQLAHLFLRDAFSFWGKFVTITFCCHQPLIRRTGYFLLVLAEWKRGANFYSCTTICYNLQGRQHSSTLMQQNLWLPARLTCISHYTSHISVVKEVFQPNSSIALLYTIPREQAIKRGMVKINAAEAKGGQNIARQYKSDPMQ